jgi:hypothetical protein
MNEDKKESVDREGYRKSVAYGVGVAVDYKGKRKVKGGPEHLAVFSGQKVSWKFLNTSGKPATFVLTVQKGAAPYEHPFVEEQPWRATASGDLGTAALTLTIKRFSEPARFHYDIQIEGEPDSTLDPELDIWP